ncbi:MAG: hypothetical protein ABIO83_06845 [Ilumatobacteraceae bacterium]
MHGTAARLRRLPDVVIPEATARIRQSIEPRLSAATGGDRRLSGVKNGKRLTIKVVKRTYGNVTEGRVMAGPPRQRAQWFWLNEGTRSGLRGTSGRRSFRGLHPGTPAKQVWTQPVSGVLPGVRREIEREFRAVVKG